MNGKYQSDRHMDIDRNTTSDQHLLDSTWHDSKMTPRDLRAVAKGARGLAGSKKESSTDERPYQPSTVSDTAFAAY